MNYLHLKASPKSVDTGTKIHSGIAICGKQAQYRTKITCDKCGDISYAWACSAHVPSVMNAQGNKDAAVRQLNCPAAGCIAGYITDYSTCNHKNQTSSHPICSAGFACNGKMHS